MADIDNSLTQVDNIQEAEVVESSSILLELENLIKNNIATITKLTSDLKQHRQMFEDGFANDSTFKEHAEAAKKAAKQKSSTRQEIIKRPGVQIIADKVKNLSAELKDRKLALSDYLLEYQRLAGTNQIEGPEGEEFEIVNEARIVKHSSKQ